jgi:phosphatidylinositol glycan class Z
MSAAVLGFLMTSAILIIGDTYYYLGRTPALGDFLPSTSTARVVITPLNNVLYNADVTNLALHGIHNRLTHLLVNLPSLIGPPLILLFTQRPHNFLALVTGLVAVLGLSFFPHQEARFLLPAVPLLLSSVRVPLPLTTRRWRFIWWILRASFAFNITLGLFMGVYHQGGVVRAQHAISKLSRQSLIDGVIWWKTYPPPDWILGSQAGKIHTHDLMGADVAVLEETVRRSIKCLPWTHRQNFLLVMPLSTKELASYVDPQTGPFHVTKAVVFNTHLNLDDMDFLMDGIISTIARVIGRRGLGVFNVHKHC